MREWLRKYGKWITGADTILSLGEKLIFALTTSGLGSLVFAGAGWLIENWITGILLGLGVFALLQVILTVRAIRQPEAGIVNASSQQPDQLRALQQATIQNRPTGNVWIKDTAADRKENKELKAKVSTLEKQLAQQNNQSSEQANDDQFKLALLKREARNTADYLRWFLKDNQGKSDVEIETLYHERYQDKITALLGQLEGGGLYPPSSRKSFEIAADKHPHSSYAISKLAEVLGSIGNDL